MKQAPPNLKKQVKCMIEKYTEEELKVIADVVEESPSFRQSGILRKKGIIVGNEEKMRTLRKEMLEKGLIRDKTKEPFWTTKMTNRLHEMIDIGYSYKDVADELEMGYESTRKKVIREYGEIPVIQLDSEEWKQYNEDFDVSNKGRIFDKRTNVLRKGTLKNGYLSYQGRPIHRMVAELFIPNPEEKPIVDHIDTNKRNNCVENLRWVTAIENMNNEETIKNMSERKSARNKVIKLLTRCLEVMPDKMEIIKILASDEV